jgi:hypothetical protein
MEASGLHPLKLGERMSPQDAKAYVDKFYALCHARHEKKVMQGRFVGGIAAGSLPLDCVRTWWKNSAQFIWEVNNLTACAYHRHIGFTRRHWDILTAFSDAVAEEYIDPEPPGHISLVIEQGKIFGIPEEEMIAFAPLAECRGWHDWVRGLLYDGTMLEWWSAKVGEELAGTYAQAIAEGLMKHYGFSRQQLPYFNVHGEADLEPHKLASGRQVIGHNELNRVVLARLLEDGEVNLRPGYTVEYVGSTTVDFIAMLFDRCASLDAP